MENNGHGRSQVGTHDCNATVIHYDIMNMYQLFILAFNKGHNMNNDKDYIDRVVHGDCRSIMAQMPDGFVQTAITSPPYW